MCPATSPLAPLARGPGLCDCPANAARNPLRLCNADPRHCPGMRGLADLPDPGPSPHDAFALLLAAIAADD